MSNQYSLESETNLSEILAALWAYKILISICIGLSIFLAGSYALNTDKKFTAKAVFQIEQQQKSGFSLPGELGSLAALAGFNMPTSSNSEALLERIMAREFILTINKNSSLEKDKFFNTYDPNYVEPFWKLSIKKALGLQSAKPERNRIIENNIIKNYRKFVKADFTDTGTISVSVTHENSDSAAKYANLLMEEIKLLIEFESQESQELRLNYLSQTLADALQEMDQAQQNLKNYALKNSAMAQENFISGSLKLDELRMEKREVSEFSEVLTVLEDLIKAGNLNKSAYEELRATFPLVDDVSFRRILGMSETISAWTWPDKETNQAVSATLKDRLKRLDIEIKNIENNAKIYATSAEDLAKFTRDAKIAEATYTVLIEQVKSQSLAAGFRPENFKVFEYATPPLSPSSPKRLLIIAIGALLGWFLGSTLALIFSAKKGVYYTKSLIASDAQAGLSLRSKSFRRLSRWPIKKIIQYISKKRISEIDQVEIKISNKKLVYVLNCGGRPTASGTARLLATQSSLSGRNVLLCDKTGQSEKELEDKPDNNVSEINVITYEKNLNIMKSHNGAEFFTSSEFNSSIKMLMARYDQIFICSDNSEAILGLMALTEFNPAIILLTRLRRTTKADIRKIKINQPIDILFYD